MVVLPVVGGVALRAGGNVSPGIREDRANRWVLVAFGVVGLLLGFVLVWSNRMGFWMLDGETLRWFGVVLFALGCVLHLAGLRAQQSLQRLGGDSAGPRTGYYRHLWTHPNSELSRAAHFDDWVVAGISLGRWPDASRIARSALSCTHSLRGTTPA